MCKRLKQAVKGGCCEAELTFFRCLVHGLVGGPGGLETFLDMVKEGRGKGMSEAGIIQKKRRATGRQTKGVGPPSVFGR